ncbi:MAG: L-serine ammonia-lyase, partial [Planctomycetota bacterium]
PRVRCTLKGSLSFTGKGHATDRAVTLGLHGHTPGSLTDTDIGALIAQLFAADSIPLDKSHALLFSPEQDIRFDAGAPLPEHPNGLIFDLVDPSGQTVLSQTYFSIGGGFINTLEQIHDLAAPLRMQPVASCPYPFDSATSMLEMAKDNNLSIAAMKRTNELAHHSPDDLAAGIDNIWHAMRSCITRGLESDGVLPGALQIPRRAKTLHDQLLAKDSGAEVTDWLSAYAMAVNEENAAGRSVVTAPTNGAAGVIPAVLYHTLIHEGITHTQIQDFLLTAAAIGGIIKHRSSISGAEVGCQGEVGSAASMAAAGLCAIRGGTPRQIENAAEIALEHHLGMTCDPVQGLVQVPCIERNAFGAVKAYTAASLALRGTGSHFMPLDACIAAMKQTGLEMSSKYKETSLGGLAVSLTEC